MKKFNFIWVLVSFFMVALTGCVEKTTGPFWHIHRVSNEVEWIQTLEEIRSSGDNKNHTINIVSDFQVQGSGIRSFGNVNNLVVKITAEQPKNIFLTSQGSFLNIGQSQKVDFEKINIFGIEDNTTSLISVSGDFNMISGSIQGNTNIYNSAGWYEIGLLLSAGGVIVGSNGTFTMQGGSIHGNTGGYGGGIDVVDGSLIMHGGTIYGNTARRDGGGVSMSGRNNSFTMYSGSIYENTAVHGGGVFVSGEFQMKGGTISSNIGGGIYSPPLGAQMMGSVAVITMSGGTVYGTYESGVTLDLANTNYALRSYEILTSGRIPIIKYGDGINVLPHTDGHEGYTEHTIFGRP